MFRISLTSMRSVRAVALKIVGGIAQLHRCLLRVHRTVRNYENKVGFFEIENMPRGSDFGPIESKNPEK